MGVRKDKMQVSAEYITYENIHKVTMTDKRSTFYEKSNTTTLYGDTNPFLMARNTIVSMDST